MVMNYYSNQYFYIKANDTLPALQIMTMTRGNLDQVLPFNLSGVTSATFSMTDSNNNLIISSAPAQITDKCKGLIQYNWLKTDTMYPGVYKAEFELYFSGSTQQQKITLPLFGQISVEIFNSINNT
jgi:hypothetical protein